MPIRLGPNQYGKAQTHVVRIYRGETIDLMPGGVDAYVLYRILSGYSHASMNIVDLYFAENGKPIPEKRQVANEALAPATLIYLTSCSLVWAGRAFSYLTKDSEHRRIIRNSAARLGVNPELQLSDNYYKRRTGRNANG